MSSIRRTPEHAAYGLLPTEAVAEAAADEAAADEAAADEAAEEVAEAAEEAAEEAGVSGLDPSGSASSSSSPRIRTKGCGRASSSATRPGKDYFYFEEERRAAARPADQGRSPAPRRQHRQAAGASDAAVGY
jgi:hypothetical protein